MKVQILCICCDRIITKTVENWKKYSDRIVVYANGPDRNFIKKSLVGISVITGPFLGYSETRNLLISLCQLEKFDINLFLDDSYEIVGKLSPERLIRIFDEKTQLTYARNLIVKSGEHYSGSIHETVVSKEQLILNENFYIIDKYNFLNELRRVKRLPSDLEKLDDSERDTIYKICILSKLSKFKEAKELLKKLPRKHPIEKYINFNLSQIEAH